MIIVDGPIALAELKRMAADGFGDLVKAVVDDPAIRAKIIEIVERLMTP